MEWLNLIITGAASLLGALGGGSVIYWRENRKKEAAEAHKSTTDARLAEADFAEKILEKYEKGILARMDSGDAVRQQEFRELTEKIDKRFDAVEADNAKQNSLLDDIVVFLNGDFKAFEEARAKTRKKK